jgi:membrane protease subunit (stomatin/prohibitin family)
MGLIKAALGSVSTVLSDQWREYFYCDSMPANVLVTKGQKRTGSNTQNTKATDNIITNGAIIAVNEGQCMMIVDQGQIVEFAAEAGEFTWDSSTESTIFYGGLGKGIKGSWENFKRRFTFGGDTAKDQRIYFFNLKEIMGNKYGTPNPLSVRIVDKNIGLDRLIDLRCNGEYSYKITDPMLFYKNVCGNITDTYTRNNLDSQLKSEFITALTPAFAKLSCEGVGVHELLGHTLDISDAINETLSDRWSGLRGISVVAVGVNPSVAPEDLKKIKELQDTGALRDPGMAAATLTGAQAEAMKTAAGNEAGAMMGFMGLNMAQMAGGMNANNLYQMAQQRPAPAPVVPVAAPVSPAPAANSWKCKCGTENTGKFCTECGSAQVVGWTCACGSVNKGKFCPECGAQKPAEAPLYRCDKCGWEPEDPKNPPKFCPECGDKFDESDVK